MKGLAGLLEDTDDGVSRRRGAEESHGEDGQVEVGAGANQLTCEQNMPPGVCGH